jgi:DNA polymerase-4
MLSRLEPIAGRVSGRLESAGRKGRTVTLKLKSHDHEVSTRQTTLRRAVRSEETLMRLAERLLGRPHPPAEPVRLLGLSVSSLTGKEGGGEQLEFDFERE